MRLPCARFRFFAFCVEAVRERRRLSLDGLQTKSKKKEIETFGESNMKSIVELFSVAAISFVEASKYEENSKCSKQSDNKMLREMLREVVDQILCRRESKSNGVLCASAQHHRLLQFLFASSHITKT